MTAPHGKNARAEREDVRLYGPAFAESLHVDINDAWDATDDDEIEEHTVYPTAHHLPAVDALLQWVCEWAAENGELDEFGYDAIDNAVSHADVEEAVRALYDAIGSHVTYFMAAEVVATHKRTDRATTEGDGRGDAS